MKYLISLLLLITAASCRHESKTEREEVPAVSEAKFYAPPPAIAVSMEVSDVEQVLIYDASLHLRVKDVSAVNDSIRKLLPKLHAYASSEHASNAENRREQKMEIRVAESHFYQLLEKLESLGEKTLTREINIEDVTGEYIDLRARLKTERELEIRYYEILKQARTVKDMLEIEAQLGEVRAEIESMESRIKHIDNRVSYSTIRLSFSEEVEEVHSFINDVTGALEDGWNNVIHFFVTVLSGWPWVILGVSLMVFMRSWRKRMRMANEE